MKLTAERLKEIEQGYCDEAVWDIETVESAPDIINELLTAYRELMVECERLEKQATWLAMQCSACDDQLHDKSYSVEQWIEWAKGNADEVVVNEQPTTDLQEVETGETSHKKQGGGDE